MKKQKRRPNHYGCLIDKGPGRNYLAKWTGPDGKPRYKTTGTSNYWQALEVLEQLALASRPDPVQDRITLLKAQLAILEGKQNHEELPLDKIWDTYKSLRWENPIAEGTARNYRIAIEEMTKWMKLHGCANAMDVTSDMAERYLKELCPKISLISYNNRLVLFKGVWKLLLEKNKGVNADTWAGFQKLKGAKSESKRRGLTNEEVRTLLENADADTRLLITLSYYTAQRVGDCCMLKWSNVDFEKKLITLIPMKTKNRTGKPAIVHMHEELLALLKTLKEHSTSEYVNERSAKDYQRRAIHGRLSALFDKCKIRRHYRDEHGRVKILTGFHALRHTWASNAANAGKLSVAGLQSVMGWASEDMAKIYVHPDSEAVAKAVDAMEKIGVA